MAAYLPAHIPVPKNAADFESRCVILFRLILGDPSVKKLGRSGQKQFGIDLVGYRKGDLKRPVGIQCKKKRPNQPLTAGEVREEVRKALKYNPKIVEYIIVTTADDDRALDQLAQQLTKNLRARGRKLRIEVWGWGTLEDEIDQYDEAKEAFDPGASPAVKVVKAQLSKIAGKQNQQATAQQLIELVEKIDRQSSMAEDQLPGAVADNEIVAETKIILARRGFPEANTAAEWATLAARVISGDLVKAPKFSRSIVLERAARSYLRPDDLDKAKSFHQAALKIDRQLDTKFYDALLHAAEEKPDLTLRALRKMDTPESRSAIFNQLLRLNGPQNAVDWLVDSGHAVADFDAGGALNVLLQKVELGDFDGALNDAQALSAEQLDALPSLYSVRASLRLSSTLPKDFKRVPFQGMPINPSQLKFASTQRARQFIRDARVDLDKAIASLSSLRIEQVRPLLEEMSLWLKLEDEFTHQEAVTQIQEEIKQPSKTLRRVRLALGYSIPFNRDALMRSLVAQKKVGNWDADEQFAAFLLAFHDGELDKTAKFFEEYAADLYENDQLSKGVLIGIEVEVLARLGRFEEARGRISKYRKIWLDADDGAHLEELVASVETGNETERLRKLYEETNELNYLRLLVLALMKESDGRQLATYAPMLLSETNRVEDYETSIKALYGDKQYSQVVDIAKKYPELHSLEDDFQSFEGWSYFSLGRVIEAQEIARSLVERRNNTNDRELDINTSIESGDWGRLQAILQREADRLESLEPRILMRLARLAFEIGSPYVEKFRDAALEKSGDDPGVYLAAYQLSVERGEEYQESRAHLWFQKAVALSGAEGPVQQVQLRDVLDRTAGWNKKVDDIDEMLSEGKVPLWFAARALHRQPIEFILGTALRNSSAKSANDKFPIIAFAGNRQPENLAGMRHAAFDLTAIFTLDYLGLLQKAIGAFEKVYIAPSTLGSLFFDRQSIRFHQPSIVEKAKRIKRLITDGKIKILIGEKTNAEIATLSIDPELQFLLDKARENGATVVRSAPVHKLRSLLEEVADLSSYSAVMTDTHAVYDIVRARVTGNVGESAKAYLEQVDQGWSSKPDISRSSVLYLDSLTVAYFDYVGILEALTGSVAGVYVSREVELEADRVLRAAELSDSLLAAIDRIRSTLNDGLIKGSVGFTSRKRQGGEDLEDGEYEEQLPTLDVMSNLTGIDVVVCDDRFLNKDFFWSDGKNRVPCATTLDLIQALNSRTSISQPQVYEYAYKLRLGGYHAVPVDVTEIVEELGRAPIEEGRLVETPELQEVRMNQTIALRSRMLSGVELHWMDHSRLVIHQAMRSLWASTLSIEKIKAQADWLLRTMPVPFRLIEDPTQDGEWAFAYQKTVTQLGLMMSPTAISEERQKEYANWIDDRLVAGFRTYNPRLFGDAVDVLANFFRRIVEESDKIPALYRKRFIAQLLENMHPKVEEAILERVDVMKAMAISLTNFVTFDGSLTISVESFVDALRAALAKKRSARIRTQDGTEEKAAVKLVRPDAVVLTIGKQKLGVGDVIFLLERGQAGSKRQSEYLPIHRCVSQRKQDGLLLLHGG